MRPFALSLIHVKYMCVVLVVGTVAIFGKYVVHVFISLGNCGLCSLYTIMYIKDQHKVWIIVKPLDGFKTVLTWA